MYLALSDLTSCSFQGSPGRGRSASMLARGSRRQWNSPKKFVEEEAGIRQTREFGRDGGRGWPDVQIELANCAVLCVLVLHRDDGVSDM
jgi:hypothetical protein